MLKIAVAIDDWKLPVFTRRLKAAGYTFETHQGITHDTLILKVMATSVLDLEPVVRAANTECAESGKPQ